MKNLAVVVLLSIAVADSLLLHHSDRAAVKRRPTRRDAEDGRLPGNVRPFHYDLELQPNIYDPAPPFSFTGSVDILVECIEATSSVVLHTRNLNYVGVSIGVQPDTPVPSPSPILLQWTIDPAAEFLTLGCANQLVPGAHYYVRAFFDGVMADDGNGLYYDSYVDTDSSTKYLAATQLESIEARQAFPCFDEPDMKATFNITVVAQPQSVVLSNMNELYTEDRGGLIAHVFAQSPVMSTYQVCLAVGDFIYQEADWQGITSYPVRIYARPQMAGNLDFAAYIAARMQAWLEEETGVPYTLPKMDHIAYPGKRGAMENWGLITYGEDYLCISPETSGVLGKLTVASVVAHELAHQWYGNLVTCKWWNDIWLNEGFATFYNYYPQQSIGWPGSETQQGDPRRGTQQFLIADQRNTSDPIRKSVDTTWDADSAFSGSTYPKGGAILRHLQSILTPATFKAGLTNYLTKYSYSTATTDDLWAELTAQAAADGVTMPDSSPLDVKTLMDAWLNQMGYPLLTVTATGDGMADVTSFRFFNPTEQLPDTPSAYNYTWNVPITVATAQTTDWDMAPSFWIDQGSTMTTISGVPDAGDWVMINARQKAFYRVDYDDDLRADIVTQLLDDHTKIPLESRSQFIDDSFTLARALYIPEVLAMDTTLYLGNDLENNAWYWAIQHFRYSERILRGFFWYTLFRSYMMDIMEPVYNVTGWNFVDMESPLDSMLRRVMLINTCFYGHSGCFETARQKYAAYKMNPSVNSLQPDELGTVLCVGVSEGTSSDWSMVFNQYQQRRSSPFPEERHAYLFAMACTYDSQWHDIYLNYIIRGEQIDVRDQNTALNYMIQSNVGWPVVWDYFDNSWNTVPSTISKFTHLRTIAQIWYTEDDGNRFNNFVGKYPPSSDAQKDMLYQMDQTILQNQNWLIANEQPLRDWLANNTAFDASYKLATPLPVSPMELYYPSKDDFGYNFV